MLIPHPVACTLLLALASLPPLPAQGKGTAPPPDPAIAYQSGGSLYVMNVDGTNQRAVVTAASTEPTLAPAWSPDGNELLFAGTPGGQANGIWAVRLDGTGLRRIATLAAGVDTGVAWSPVPAPDGRAKVAFIAPVTVNANEVDYEVFLVDADGASSAVRLTTTDDHEMDVTWTRDGTRLVVTALAMADGAKPYAAVLTLGLDGGNQIVVTGRFNFTMLPGSPLAATDGLNWAIRDPDCAHHSDVVLLSVRKPGVGDALWVVDLANPTAPGRLDPTASAEFFGCWSGDDRRICFRRTGASRTANGLYRAEANGTGAVQILRGGQFPAWRPTR